MKYIDRKADINQATWNKRSNGKYIFCWLIVGVNIPTKIGVDVDLELSDPYFLLVWFWNCGKCIFTQIYCMFNTVLQWQSTVLPKIGYFEYRKYINCCMSKIGIFIFHFAFKVFAVLITIW